MSENIQTKTGAEILVDKLHEYGIDTIFCITGAGNLAIIDAATRHGNFSLIFSHHEQAAVMEAQGYSRVSGKIGVALVTTGGGAANSLTGVLSAFLDSIPVLIIAGNESSYHCQNEHGLRAYGVQGFDASTTMQTVSKYSTRIEDLHSLNDLISNSIMISTQDRMGPVFLDFPMDLQRKVLVDFESRSHLASREKIENELNSDINVGELIKDLASSKSPLLYIGNGCRSLESKRLLIDIISKYKIPFVLSWSAIDLLPEVSEFCVGRVGIYGERAANIVLQKSDLLVCIGTRLAIPQIGYDKPDFARKAIKWVIEIDKSECSKFSGLSWNIVNTSSQIFLTIFEKSLRDKEIAHLDFSAWQENIIELKLRFPKINQIGSIKELGDMSEKVHSASVMEFFNTKFKGDSIFVTDVGAGLLTGHYMLEPKSGQRLFTSQGLGEMGFGLPAAIGAYFGDKTKKLICLNTDGGIMFNLQELQLITHFKIPIKLFIFNNSGYTMIKVSQQNLFNSLIVGSSPNTGISFPNFEKVAGLFGMDFLRLTNIEHQENSLLKALDTEKAILIEVVMNEDQKYLPRLATSKLSDGSLVSPPLEDLEPKIDLSELEVSLGYRANKNSYAARGINFDE